MQPRKIRNSIALVLGVLIAGFSAVLLISKEPSYHGRHLSDYLEHLATNSPALKTDDPAFKAIYAMGPRTIPYLRHSLFHKKSLYQQMLARIQAGAPAWFARQFPKPRNAQYYRGLSNAAARALAMFGECARPAMPQLIECFKQPPCLNLAFFAVMEIGPRPADLSAFLQLTKSPTWGAPAHALTCIAKIGVTNSEVLQLLEDTAADRTSDQWMPVELRESAIDALGELGPKAHHAENVLTLNLIDFEAVIRVKSARALWLIHGRSNAPIEFLVNMLPERVPLHDEGALNMPRSNLPLEVTDPGELSLINWLAEIGTSAAPAVPRLRQARNHADIRIALAATKALWAINHENVRTTSLCLVALQHGDPQVRYDAAKLLSEICIAAHTPLPEFNDLLRSKDSYTQFHVARAVWKLTGHIDDALPFIVDGLQDHYTDYHDAEIRQLAAETLGEMSAQSTIPQLRATLNDERENVRLAATNALKRIERSAAFMPLQRPN